jgi:hypothetical protein
MSFINYHQKLGKWRRLFTLKNNWMMQPKMMTKNQHQLMEVKMISHLTRMIQLMRKKEGAVELLLLSSYSWFLASLVL